MAGRLIVVSGAQFGSEGKGAVVDQLTRPEHNSGPVAVVRVAGPNAGHTVFGVCPPGCQPNDEHLFNGEWIGHPWKLRSVPVGAVSNPAAELVVAAGSEVDLEVLTDEINRLNSAGYNVSERLHVDTSATVLTPQHVAEEVERGLSGKLGSTAKGIGAARAARVWREAPLFGDVKWSLSRTDTDTAGALTRMLDDGQTVVIEGTQGYGLGQHAGWYPQCTSSDCRAVDFLSMAGLSPWHPAVGEFEVWLAARVRPIRVAGNSGPLKGETSWDALGLPTERTTVTQKVRRVGEWDGDLVRRAVQANGGAPVVRLALTMVDTVFPPLAGLNTRDDIIQPESELDKYLTDIEIETRAPVRFVGTSPTTGIRRVS
jgi:adenylosuccinate synthase